ncbi:tetratricopeptide repeat protein [Siphonobacter sp. SORGH_AS_0500]|uniref:tetratricopeptide repeat protein n=1 Tax=Siphonobacter sp. SORGH_AS_0500 TaxID=1864824 RepID=UPI00285D6CF9|nr:tetratricopeptide repeat protein [Siphonobacter sp. SORGH_AS_0500]MDR6193365.1 putative negative regulator of RcsB-dependent stress response [Siphonobacter sp. SORGH_AS_0500]
MAKKNSGLEFLESPEGLAGEFGKAQSFFDKNQKVVYGIIAAAIIVVAGFFGYQAWQDSQNADASAALFPAVNEFEADSLNKALKGGPGVEGLVSIADEYGSTKSGKLANFYAGVALLKQGKFDDAIEHLKDFSSNDLLVQARAYALIGDAYLEKRDTENAISYYKKAVDYKPNKFFTPTYLLKLATAYEVAKQNKEAIDSYSKIIEEYPQSAEYVSAKKYKAILEGPASE